ncbi:hypothetical protein RJ639_047630 [Escallonia herrerae]|uniref:DOG1 domain-containing protein n=1 Tax=Escallonia herrerae TaxID=1293975 RepID=A0AA88W8B3_9ASTE|nr:hypothetical protein RJ639_047630 [Escallonia herrerae]
MEAFTAFFEGWLVRQQDFLHKLLAMSRSSNATDEQRLQLVEEVINHYREYYDEKFKAANHDVFVVFSPPWLSSFERSLLWIAGFKPAMIFELVTWAVGHELTAEQMEKLEVVRAAMTREEREIGTVMARVQESVAAPPLSDLVRLVGRLVDGEVTDFDTAMGDLKAAMMTVMEKAEALRGSTFVKVVEVLTPRQAVMLLLEVTRFQVQVRRWGSERDARRVDSGVDSDE